MICPICNNREITKKNIKGMVQIFPRHSYFIMYTNCNTCGAKYFSNHTRITKQDIKYLFNTYPYNYWGTFTLCDFEDYLPFGLTFDYNRMVEKINNFKNSNEYGNIDTMSLLP